MAEKAIQLIHRAAQDLDAAAAAAALSLEDSNVLPSSPTLGLMPDAQRELGVCRRSEAYPSAGGPDCAAACGPHEVGSARPGHICAGTGPHLRRDWPTSAPGPACASCETDPLRRMRTGRPSLRAEDTAHSRGYSGLGGGGGRARGAACDGREGPAEAAVSRRQISCGREVRRDRRGRAYRQLAHEARAA